MLKFNKDKKQLMKIKPSQFIKKQIQAQKKEGNPKFQIKKATLATSKKLSQAPRQSNAKSSEQRLFSHRNNMRSNITISDSKHDPSNVTSIH